MKQVKGTAVQLVGRGKLIDPARVVRVVVSPRKRTRQTFQHLFGDPDAPSGSPLESKEVEFSEDLTEWDYGDYEGWVVNDIRAGRKARGLDQEREWNIWRDGCEGGESVF